MRERMIVAALQNFDCKVIAIVKNNVFSIYKISKEEYIKAPVGQITKIKTLNNYPQEIISLYVNTKIGDISENATCWRSREGIVEFYWNKKFDHIITEHLELANKISNEIFEVAKL